MFADNEQLQYQYDAAGNRVMRSVVQPQPRQSPRNVMYSATVDVSPTLTHDLVAISTTEDIGKHPMRYSLVTLQGNVLKSGFLPAQQSVLSLGEYSDGIYLLTVESEAFTRSYKIIKRQ